MTAFSKPEIVSVINAEGIALKQRGKNLWALCPFHLERNPSFKVDPERQTFFCFGCNTGGDVIHFIEKLKSLSFKDACKYLGISTGTLSPDALKGIERKRKLIANFRAWEARYHSQLCSLYRCLQKAKLKIKTEQELESIASFYHTESLWLSQIEILEGDDDEAKFNLFMEVGNV